MKGAYYFFRVLSYAAGTGALALFLTGRSAATGWIYALVGLSFVCFVMTWFLMLWIRMRR